MKQIIPFKKDLVFSTKISEITSISLEHNLKLKESDFISGELLISGDYKMTAISLNKEDFAFDIPFDISLDKKYNINNVLVDIDDFYYEIINSEILRVNIDISVDGIEVVEEIEREPNTIENEELELVRGVGEEEDLTTEVVREEPVPMEEINYTTEEEIELVEELAREEEINKETEVEPTFEELERELEVVEEEEIELLEEREDNMDAEIVDINTNKEVRTETVFQEVEEPPTPVVAPLDGEKIKSLFDSFDDKDEPFSTYHVYIVRKEDTVETITTRYGISKDDLSIYNNLDELKLGDKLIIPKVTNE